MATGRSGSDGSASAKPYSRQDVENDRELRSRLESILNVPRGYTCGAFFACGLAGGHFEHPAQLDGRMIS